MKHECAAYLSPAETARRLGVTIKALRLYEKHGLVAPLRSDAGWRAYGPAEIARLHQVLALKRLGLKLARIAELMAGRMAGLGDVLAFQEQMLAGESARVSHALALVRSARAKLAGGDDLSIDDLTQLTMETTMTTKATPDELKAIFDPISAKHFSAEESAALTAAQVRPGSRQPRLGDLDRGSQGADGQGRCHLACGQGSGPALARARGPVHPGQSGGRASACGRSGTRP